MYTATVYRMGIFSSIVCVQFQPLNHLIVFEYLICAYLIAMIDQEQSHFKFKHLLKRNVFKFVAQTYNVLLCFYCFSNIITPLKP